MKMNQAPVRATGRISILRDERGLSTVEYVVLLVLICAACVGLWATFGGDLVDRLGTASEQFRTNVPGSDDGGTTTENRE